MRIVRGGWILLALWPVIGAEPVSTNCTFQSNPDQFLGKQAALVRSVYNTTSQVSGQMAGKLATGREAPRTVSGNDLPRYNLIDVQVFDRLVSAGVPAAAISGDYEFLRRVTLDLAGRLPDPTEITGFVADTTATKRRAVIDKLLNSPEFVEKWTMWLGDLLQNSSNTPEVATRGLLARNSFYNWLRAAIANAEPLKDIAYESAMGRGNSQDPSAPANFVLNGRTTGPAQDTYDMMMVKTATTWLGIGHYDCLSCHDGRGHLTALSLYATRLTRIDANYMAAFFARTRVSGDNVNGFIVSDAVTGTYDLNTNYGNRPNRVPIGTLKSLTPQYRETSAAPPDNDWRKAFAENLVRDPMLARNLANRIWKQMFGLGLVEPVDSLDPDRLDPAHPPANPGALAPLQATHPLLLEQLAQYLTNTNYNLRELVRLIAESGTYQLSSQYDGKWSLDYVQLFARHYPRRLEGEEIHDAIQKATGVVTSYTITGWPDAVTSAVRLPEPLEPRSNGTSLAFMNNFYRGNRDNVQRNQAGSILQQLSLMNNTFVTTKTKVAASPNLKRWAAMTDNAGMLNDMYLTFLSRPPTAAEAKAATALLTAATTATARNTVVEDLAWVLTNQIEFLFSY